MYQEWLKKYEEIVHPQEKILKDEIWEKIKKIYI